MPDLTQEQIKNLLEKLDNVCAQAKALSDQLRSAMVDRARNEQQVLSTTPTPKRPTRKHR